MQAYIRTELVESSWGYDERMPTQTKKVKRVNVPEDELAMDAGTQVRVTDGKAGRIDELMVDPDSGSNTHLMLRKGPLWAAKEVTVPITEVERMDNRAVYLRTNRAGIEALPAAQVSRK